MVKNQRQKLQWIERAEVNVKQIVSLLAYLKELQDEQDKLNG